MQRVPVQPHIKADKGIEAEDAQPSQRGHLHWGFEGGGVLELLEVVATTMGGGRGGVGLSFWILIDSQARRQSLMVLAWLWQGRRIC